MNKTILLLTLLAFAACKKNPTTADEKQPVPQTPSEWIQNATVYEVNLRHYSPKGDINGFIPHLDRLQKLGVDVLWFMPIHPIGSLSRKAKGDVFTQDIKDSVERQKYLGSPYSISDYRTVNPDFGSVEDFKKLVDLCHEKGFKVLLDWVGNHTAWDHAWVKAHPDWYTQVNGKITDPLTKEGKSMGWTDVDDLNYENTDLRKAMIADMAFWVSECDIGGFRCDVAFEVPADFWAEAATEIKKTKDIFMLAEAESHEMALFDSTFQAYYSWTVHHFMNELAKGKITTQDFYNEWFRVDSIFGDKAFPMNFITNHDENSWNGTEFERMDDRWRAMAVLSYALKGMPLIYTGQEVGLSHRMKFFEKDSVNWQKDSADYFTAFYTKLNALKAAPDMAVNAATEVLVDGELFVVKKDNHLFKFNFSKTSVKIELPKGSTTVLQEQYKDDNLGSWGYVVQQLKP